MADLQSRIARLEAELKARIERAEKATSGSWRRAGRDVVSITSEHVEDIAEALRGLDATFIANARTEHPQAHRALLSIVDAIAKMVACGRAAERVADSLLRLIERELGVTGE